MAKINKNYQKLSAGYLFPEIAKRTNLFLNENPGVQVMRLGIGDTTEPIVPSVLQGLHQGWTIWVKWRVTRVMDRLKGLIPLGVELQIFTKKMVPMLKPMKCL